MYFGLLGNASSLPVSRLPMAVWSLLPLQQYSMNEYHIGGLFIKKRPIDIVAANTVLIFMADDTRARVMLRPDFPIKGCTTEVEFLVVF